MQVLVQSRHRQDAEMHARVERRVRFVLRRLTRRVPRADVQITDVNGPRGGVDTRCQIELRTDGAGPVVVSSVGRTWRSALDEALARAARRLLRQWHRLRAGRQARPHTDSAPG